MMTLSTRLTTATAFLAIALAAGSPEAAPRHGDADYLVLQFASFGGTNSRGNSINNRGWIAGYSNISGNHERHAALWLYGFGFDLGTLGGPNSSVAWSQGMNRDGLIAGISQTDIPEPLGQQWSCRAFFPLPDRTGFTCVGVVWERGEIRELPRLGGHNSFATGVNESGEIAGWSETDVRDSSCHPEDGNQVLQFLPVIWGPGEDEIREMPLIPDDSSGTVNALNDHGQAVGISGDCDMAVGRRSARHAVLWEDGEITDLGNVGAEWWNTPTAINQQGDVTGFLGDPDDPDGFLQAFLWTEDGGLQELGTLTTRPTEHVHSEAYGINERGQVVGLSCDATFNDCRAFLWEDGEMTDLNDRIAFGDDDTLLHARDINDLGMITGFAFDDEASEQKTYWAIPLPGHRRHGAARGADDRVRELPDEVKRAILHPLGSGRARLNR